MRIRAGIASFGMSGRIFHAPFLEAHPGYELAAIVERHKDESRAHYPQARLYRSFEEMLADGSIQLVVVNTPVQLHLAHTRAALLAGKHVITEKPFTVTAQEAIELEQLAGEKGLSLTVYQNRRYDGDYLAVQEVLNKGWLGELKEAEVRFDRYRPAASGKLHKEADLPGAGTLHDLGAHLIDQALQLFGWPEAVFADIRTLRAGLGSNDYFELLLYYPGLRVRLKSTMLARETYPAYILHGTLGSFLQERTDRQEEELGAGRKPTQDSWCPGPSSPDGLLHTEIGGQLIRRPTTSSPGNYMGFYDDVYEMLASKGRNPVPAAQAVQTMRIIEAALQSAEEKKLIPLG